MTCFCPGWVCLRWHSRSCVYPTGGTEEVLSLVSGCLLAHFQVTLFHSDVLSECLYIDESQENDAEATRLQDQPTTGLYCGDYNNSSPARVLEEAPSRWPWNLLTGRGESMVLFTAHLESSPRDYPCLPGGLLTSWEPTQEPTCSNKAWDQNEVSEKSRPGFSGFCLALSQLLVMSFNALGLCPQSSEGQKSFLLIGCHASYRVHL